MAVFAVEVNQNLHDNFYPIIKPIIKIPVVFQKDIISTKDTKLK